MLIIVYRINQGSYIFPATLHLMGVVMNYIQSPSDSHAQALKFLLEHVLFVFSAVIGHKIPYPSDHKVPDPSDHKVPDPSDHKVPDPSDHKVPDPSVGIRKINNLLMRWIEDSNVIGGKCFGGWTGQKLKEELKVSILHVFCACIRSIFLQSSSYMLLDQTYVKSDHSIPFSFLSCCLSFV